MIFELNEEQDELFYNFCSKHNKKHYFSKGAIGGWVTIHIYPTSIGEAIEVECNICNKKLTLKELE